MGRLRQRRADWLYLFSHVWSFLLMEASYKGVKMADKSPRRDQKKPGVSIKDKRAAKRAKSAESESFIRPRKGA